VTDRLLQCKVCCSALLDVHGVFFFTISIHVSDWHEHCRALAGSQSCRHTIQTATECSSRGLKRVINLLHKVGQLLSLLTRSPRNWKLLAKAGRRTCHVLMVCLQAMS